MSVRKRFLIWWLETFGYVPKRRELVGIAVMLLVSAALMFWLTENLYVVGGFLIVAALCVFAYNPRHFAVWDEWDEEMMQERIAEARKRLEAGNEH